MPGVYISYPFCGQKCTYCNFASGVLPAALERRYIDSLARELQSHSWPWTPETVYLGGGTPSRLEPAALERILDSIPGKPWSEATVEAAPGGITPDHAKSWRDFGINRVSLGVQSFDDRELRSTGRRHNAEIVAAEVATLRNAGIRDVNIDLIVGLPHQTRETFERSLDWIERLAPPHVSVYLLEVDEDSRLGLEILHSGERYGARTTPSEDIMAELYELAVERLHGTGIERYEISNFARPGSESRHNLKYWRLEPYAGFGADAHGFDGRLRYQNAEQAGEYVERMESKGSARVAETAADLDQERFFVGLRLMRGIAPQEWEWRRWDEPIRRFTELGLLERDGDLLRLTNRGVLLSNEVLQEFVTS